MSEPTVLFATFTARPGHGDEVAALLRAFAEAVQREAGNVVFDATRHVDRGDEFFVYEVYRDRAAFETHLASADSATFNTALAPLITEPTSRLSLLRRV